MSTTTFELGRRSALAGVWTRDVSKAHWFIRELDCDQVMVNTFSNGVELPFSGRKRSGFGVEKGFEGLLAFTRSKGAVVAIDEWQCQCP